MSADTLGLLTVLLIPVQVLLIFFAMRGFAQGWNVEVEVPIDKLRERVGRSGTSGGSAAGGTNAPATAQ